MRTKTPIKEILEIKQRSFENVANELKVAKVIDSKAADFIWRRNLPYGLP